MKELTITIALAGCLTACGLSSEAKETLRVEMLGTSEVPASATGTSDPKWETFTLTGLSMVSEDETEVHTLYDGTDPQEVKVVNRAQLIYQKDVSDLAGKTMSAITVNFEADVSGASAKQDDLSVTLQTTTFTLAEEFVVEDGKTRTLRVRVQWGATVDGETLQEPEIALDFP